jgi:hypothetical protein
MFVCLTSWRHCSCSHCPVCQAPLSGQCGTGLLTLWANYCVTGSRQVSVWRGAETSARLALPPSKPVRVVRGDRRLSQQSVRRHRPNSEVIVPQYRTVFLEPLQ